MPAQQKTSIPTPDWMRRLRDIRGCRRELARIFGEARDRGDGWADAGKAAYILHTIAKLLEQSEVEKRIEALEQALADRERGDAPGQRPRSNGHHREARL